ncbi:hypothetical protein LC607_06300 [Nostoc sp. CHAB 5824]|nr:hypothetical protein [Nostoc sp. CHAB 5824]
MQPTNLKEGFSSKSFFTRKLFSMLKCAEFVQKLAIAVPVNVKNTIMITVNAVPHLAVAAPNLVNLKHCISE